MQICRIVDKYNIFLGEDFLSDFKKLLVTLIQLTSYLKNNCFLWTLVFFIFFSKAIILLLLVDQTIVPNKTWNSSTQWVKGNVGQNGFYRVNYPVNNWKLLAEQLQYNHSVSCINQVILPPDFAFLATDVNI